MRKTKTMFWKKKLQHEPWPTCYLKNKEESMNLESFEEQKTLN